ncbi:glycosyltransferase family 2 protein [Vibrio hyugaensis]|uniref:glycosyltransferase family 2 protein n=1 Tax=Vibrio hyugaensis TaxID=1534743 RepID=UPI000CE2BADA|nr:glycosyltransferase family A protein [Vibrio hyugaensis]
MDKVTIIIPTYQCLEYLPKALDSVFHQTHLNFEVIVINDGGDLSTQRYLESLLDHRLRYLNTEGVGVAEARNLGVKEATGDYIAFLDADDFWLPDKLKIQVALHKSHPDLALSFSNYVHVSESYEAFTDCFQFWNQLQNEPDEVLLLSKPLDTIIANNIIGTSTVMLDAKLIEAFPMFKAELPYAEDWELWLRICEKYQVGVVNSIQVGYLIRQGSITNTKSRKLQQLACLNGILDTYRKSASKYDISPSALKKANARILEGYADYYRGAKSYSKAIALNMRSWIQDPQSRRLRRIMVDGKALVLSNVKFIPE